MARIIKIDNALKKRFSKIKQKKQIEIKELKAYFLIVCEGEKTEPNYFKSFPRKVGAFVYDFTFEGGGISTIKVVEKAIELRVLSPLKYDRVWAVFDKDSFLSNQFNGAISKAKSNNIGCAWSNEAFELWYLLHFLNRVTAMQRDEYQAAIEKVINKIITHSSKSKKIKLFKYKKNAPDMYFTLLKYGNQQNAIRWAKALVRQHTGRNFSNYNPCTKVFELVEELTGESITLNTEIRRKYETGE